VELEARVARLVWRAFALIAAAAVLAVVPGTAAAAPRKHSVAAKRHAADRVMRQLDRFQAVSAHGLGRGHWRVRFRSGALRHLRRNRVSSGRWQVKRRAGWRRFPPRARTAAKKRRDRTAPSVSWTSPAPNSQVTAVTPENCLVDARDNVGVARVDFMLDGRLVDHEAAAPYQCAVDLTGVAAGGHVLAARAVDLAGNAASSSIDLVVLGSPGTQPADGSSPGNWQLTFSDDFDGSTLDRTKWGTGWGASFSKPTHFLDEQLFVSDGSLRIVAERQSTPSGRPYAGGLIQTRSQFGQRYGRFEARMKVPKGRALWPAFWMMPSTGEWPPEIDVMEMVGQSPSLVYQTNHYAGSSGQDIGDQCIHRASADLSLDYHTYSIEWAPGLLVWKVDGVETCRRTQHVDHGAMYMIVDLAVGSHDGLANDWVGMPDSTTVFPANLSIDWVRAYRAE
jgi:beta-glucanase (GH16 family)